MATTVSSGSRRRAVRPEINVTPLVDVVLVLLIIFLVVAPRAEGGAAVDLPAIGFPDEAAKGRLDPIEVTYDAAGRYWLEQEEVAKAEVEARLRGLHDADAARRVVLRGDRTLAWGEVRGLFVLCERIGFAGVSLLVAATAEQVIPEGVPVADVSG